MEVYKAIWKDCNVKQLRLRKESKGDLSATTPEEPGPLRFHYKAEQRKASITDTLNQKAGVFFNPKPEHAYCM